MPARGGKPRYCSLRGRKRRWCGKPAGRSSGSPPTPKQPSRHTQRLSLGPVEHGLPSTPPPAAHPHAHRAILGTQRQDVILGKPGREPSLARSPVSPGRREGSTRYKAGAFIVTPVLVVARVQYGPAKASGTRTRSCPVFALVLHTALDKATDKAIRHRSRAPATSKPAHTTDFYQIGAS